MEPSQNSRYSVLIADDVPELRRLLMHVLELSDRFDVVGEVADGAEAVVFAEEHKPDLILLDISMPVMDGIEALPKILAASPATRVVILSGFEAERMGRLALDAGAAAYIEKGIPPGMLVSQLLEIIEERQPAHQATTSLTEPNPTEASISDFSAEEMMSLVAHEVRNPLAVIQGFGTELQNRWTLMSEEKRLDAVRRMTERARFLNTVVNNLMFMRRLQSGQVWLDPVPIDLGSFLKDVWDELDDLARGHPVKVELAEDLVSIVADAARLRQVLTNLVVNAAKFAPAGTTITIKALTKDDRVLVHVIDEGPGIPEGSREEVFGKFRQLHEAGSGIGLGLFICRALMRSMRGGIYIEDVSPGTTFCLDLPAADGAT